MLTLNSFYGKTKLLSYLILVIPIVVEAIVLRHFPTMATIELSIYWATGIFLFLPIRENMEKASFIDAVLSSFLVFALRILDLQIGILILLTILILVIHIFYDTRKSILLFQTFKRHRMIIFFLESETKLVSCSILSFMGLLIMISIGQKYLNIIVIVLLGFLYVLTLFYVSKCRCYMLKHTEEKQIREEAAKLLKEETPSNKWLRRKDEQTEKGKMFKRIEDLMINERLYLRNDLSLNDLTTMLCTNKTYLSSVINSIYGDSFPNFIHQYRIQYSIDLMRKNPNTKIDDLAILSGYNSTSHYSNNFRRITGMTPGRYVDKIIAERLKSANPSNQSEAQQ